MNIRKNINILSLFTVFAIALVVVAMPVKTHANDFERILDPLCIFSSCDRDGNKTVVRVINNNTNTNTNTNTVTAPTSGGSSNPVVVVQNPTYPSYPSYPTYPTYQQSPMYVSCYSTPTSGGVGDTITWRVSPSGGNGSYYITWSGSENLSGYGYSVSKSYYSSGSKYASVTVTSGGQTMSQNCSNNVEIYNYNNNYNYNYQYPTYNNNYNYNYGLTVSCTPSVTFAPIGTSVTWTASATGGNGYYSYSWSGSDYLSGAGTAVSVAYNSPGVKSGTVTAYSNGQSVTRTCPTSVTVGVPVSGYQTPAPTVTNNYYTTPAKAPVVKAPVVEKPVAVVDNPLSAASYFSLDNVPWGWVAILIILILLSMVIYLMYNKKKI